MTIATRVVTNPGLAIEPDRQEFIDEAVVPVLTPRDAIQKIAEILIFVPCVLSPLQILSFDSPSATAQPWVSQSVPKLPTTMTSTFVRPMPAWLCTGSDSRGSNHNFLEGFPREGFHALLELRQTSLLGRRSEVRCA